MEDSATLNENESSNKNIQESRVEVEDCDQDVENTKFDVIGIHGLHGHFRETWPAPSGSQSQTWLANIFSSTAPNATRVILYGYNSDVNTDTCYTLRGIYQEAETLLETLSKLRTSSIKKTMRPICFIAHDVGGIIVKAAMILASHNTTKYADILYSTRVIVFFGCPHRTFRSHNLEEQLRYLISLHKERYENCHLSRLIRNFAYTMTEINSRFIHTKILTQAMLMNVFSSHKDPSKRVFDRFTATINSPFMYQMSIDKPHLDLTNSDDSSLDPLRDRLDQEWLMVHFPVDLSATLRKLLNQSSPVFPCLDVETMTGKTEVEDLRRTNSGRILYIELPSGMEKTTEQVWSYLNEHKVDRQMVLYFSFSSHDIRFNSIQAMLVTFLAQAIHNRSQQFGSHYLLNTIGALKELEAWTVEDLYAHWECLRVQRCFSKSMYVLGCLDECDASALSFLSRIRNLMMRAVDQVKMVITATKGTLNAKRISDELSKFPKDAVVRIDYSPPSVDPTSVGFKVAMFLQEDPRYTANGLQEDVKALLVSCTSDLELSDMLVKWLKSSQDPTMSVSQLLARSRTPGPELIFDAILSEVPNESRPWAQKLLSWMVSSLRPLRVAEFLHVSNLCLEAGQGPMRRQQMDEINVQPYFLEILQHFRGILISIHDEVRFGHPLVHRWLRSGELSQEQSNAWYRQKTEHERHVDILQTCLTHLQEDTDSSEAWAAQLPYATQFWTHHYKKAGRVEDVLETIFERRSILERWMDAYMALRAPCIKPLETSGSPLPIAAHFGLCDIVKSILIKQEDDAESHGQALVEAARGAQFPVLRQILDCYSFKSDPENHVCLQDALKAASCCGNPDLYRELVNHISKLLHSSQLNTMEEKESLEGFPQRTENDDMETMNTISIDKMPLSQTLKDAFLCLKETICRASWLGLEDVVTKLLSMGVNPNPPESALFNGMTPIHLVARTSHLATAKLLLDAGASLDALTDDADDTPLSIAATYGHHDMVKILLEHRAAIDVKDRSGWMPLQTACAYGNLVAVEVLLRHKSFREYLARDAPDPPLLVAAKWGHIKTVEALLRYGDDPDIPNDTGETALWHAINSGRIDVCRLLLEYEADPDLTPESKVVPLVEAVIRRNLDIVKLLVDHGAYIDKKELPGSGWQRTPMQVAVCYNYPEIVEFFLSRDAEVEVTDEDGWRPLWTAAKYNHQEVVRILVDAKADINSVCTEGELAPLHAAFEYPEIVRILLKDGADITMISKDGDTPLDYAIKGNKPEAIKVMLNESKNPKKKSRPHT